MKEEEIKTTAVNNCQTFAELEVVIRHYSPFISNSRDTPVVWKANRIIRRIFLVIDGGSLSNVTRANGLRNKVKELLQGVGIKSVEF